MLRVESLEDRRRQERRRPGEGRGEVGADRARVGKRDPPENPEESPHFLDRRGLVERNPDAFRVNAAKVEALGLRGGVDALGCDVADRERVKKRLVPELRPGRAQAGREHLREKLRPSGDPP